ncbi:hypothetical protein [Fodinibius halophilus]|uniref:Lipoprotein n=1 Tax=Fodinibius halophilus TaxID=1736908 RepID=A0A6M1T862_9BACT|nr:hypothetical protein [Fodinibius halophilus]NGP89645.1 hypothetical protein [Fodinibius halophilus]
MKFSASNTQQNQLKVIGLILGMLLVGSCNQGVTPEPLPAAPNEKLAYAVAAALDNPDVRKGVHSAMDASPYREHKLVFGEFLSQPEGAALKKAVAQKLGGEDVLNRLLDELPSMDFYLPYETHRETWEHAKSNLFVTCVLDPDIKEATSYHPDGSTETFTSRQAIKEAKIAAMFSLHPQEPKIHKDSLSARRKGYVVTSSRNGGKIQASTTTRVVGIKNYTNDGIFGGDCEFYFMSRRLDESHATKSGMVSVKPALPDLASTKNTNLFIYDGAISASNKLKVRVKEADGGVNGGDDDYGYFIADGPDDYETSKNEGAIGGFPGHDGDPPKAIITLENKGN